MPKEAEKIDPGSFCEVCEVWKRQTTADFVVSQKYVKTFDIYVKIESVNVNDRVRPVYVNEVATMKLISWYDSLIKVDVSDKVRIGGVFYTVMSRPIRYKKSNSMFGVLFVVEDVADV